MSVKVRKKGTDEWTFVAGLGRPGPAGPGGGGSGEQGPPGESAYEIAVEDGFEGTEEEWLASLRGENGAPGEDGATFTPEVSEAGILSWSNDKGLPNPDPVNIKGPAGEGSGGVTSFNSRTGAVTPQSGDYTADMVGAIPAGDVTAIVAVTQTEYDALSAKNASTLYVIKEG